MSKDETSPLRERMIEDVRIRRMGEKAQKAHIRAINHFAAYRGRSPGTATPEDLRAYQLHMTNNGAALWTFNVRITSLRFFFRITCAHEEMKRYMQLRCKSHRLPIVLRVQELGDLLSAIPGPG